MDGSDRDGDSDATEELNEADILLLEAEYFEATFGMESGDEEEPAWEPQPREEREESVASSKRLTGKRKVRESEEQEDCVAAAPAARKRKRLQDSSDTDSDKGASVAVESEGAEEHSTAVAAPEAAGAPLLLDEGTGAAVPAPLASKLRPYQVEGVQFLFKQYAKGQGAILADDMGLGKTVQSIAFLSAVIAGQKSAEQHKTALIVTPASVMSQWQGEIVRWQPSIRVGKFHGNKGTRMYILTQVKAEKFDAVLTSYETFRSEITELNKVAWSVALFDEAHRLKDMNSGTAQAAKKLLCRRRFGLTGTIMQNKLEELWNVVDWAVPEHLGSLDRMRDRFINPIKFGQRIDASDTELAVGRKAALELSLAVKQVVLRRDKTLIKHLLPEKIDQVLFCPMAPEQQKLYAALMKLPEVSLMVRYSELCHCGSGYHRGKCHGAYTPDGKEVRSFLLPTINRLQKLACHPLLLLPNPKQKEEKRAKDQELLGKVCAKEDAQRLEEKGVEDEGSYCGKLFTLKPLLPVWLEAGHKVLIFSKSTRMLDVLEAWLSRQHYSHLRYDGSIAPGPKRQAIIDEFSTSKKVFILLLSTGAGALGLNITAANIVVIFDPSWNASIDLQAQDRAFRLGQKKDCRIFRLIASGTIEEAQYQRQLYKQQMQNISLEGKRERRLFTGVQGVQGQEGELFGISNLLKQSMDTLSIVDRNKDVESGGGPAVAETAKTVEHQPATGELSLVLNTMDQKALEAEREKISAVMKRARDGDRHTTAKRPGKGKAGQQAEDAVVAALIKQSGVEYSHRNDQVIGESTFENEKSAAVHERVLKGVAVRAPIASEAVAREKDVVEKDLTNKRKTQKKTFQSKLDLMLKQTGLF